MWSKKCKQVCQKLSKACQETGFIIINNPPLKESEIDAMYAESRLFFELPEQDKQQIIGSECHYVLLMIISDVRILDK